MYLNTNISCFKLDKLPPKQFIQHEVSSMDIDKFKKIKKLEEYTSVKPHSVMLCMDRPERAISNSQPPHSLSGLNWVFDMCMCICKDKKNLGKKKNYNLSPPPYLLLKKWFNLHGKIQEKSWCIPQKNYKKMTFLHGFFCTIKSTKCLATHPSRTNHTSHFVLNIIELSFY